MNSNEIRKKFLKFFKERGHAVVPSSSLIPDDPSVLLTTAGMQQFKPYYTGELDPMKDFGNKNTASIQKCFRMSDIDEVGDESHLTFFEMLGNFSFGGYFKKEAIKYAHDFVTKEMGLTISYATVFKGSRGIPKDEESKRIWNELGVRDVREEGIEEVFWGPTGSSGPCGPTTEIYVGGTEVWNIVFNEFYMSGPREELMAGKTEKLEPLKAPGVDTGMGFERLAMAAQKTPTIFETDLFRPLVGVLPPETPTRVKRISADHARGIAFLISDGVRPSNKEAGYVLRRLIRRLITHFYLTGIKVDPNHLFAEVFEHYEGFYPELNREIVLEEFGKEKEGFGKVLERGVKEFDNFSVGKALRGRDAFYLYQSFGFPREVMMELCLARGMEFDGKGFEEEMKKHQDISRAGAGIFKGGLADQEPQTIRLHTAHHLLLASFQSVLGQHVKQRGSHITSKRLRMDFSHPNKMTDEELKQIEDMVNEKIKEDLKVVRKEMRREEAERIGAEMEFGAKYPDTVSVYFIKDKDGSVFSKEFCGGPHVRRTSEVGEFKILKEEAVAAGVRRIRATVE